VTTPNADQAPSAPDLTTPTRPLPAALEYAIVASACLVALVGLAPEAVLTDSLPWRTDLAGHVVVSWLDRGNPLVALPGAWSDAMYAGFPLNQLYPPLPSLLAVPLSYLMPLTIAFKVVVVLPLVLLPWAAWRAGRWAALAQPMPLVLAVAALPFMYDTSCVTCGGTIPSTVNGEFAFAWGLLFGVLALGAVDRVAREGRGGPVAALLVAATAVSHPLPTLWLVVGVFVITVGRGVWERRDIARPFAAAALGAALLSAAWWIPFLARREWMPVLGLERRDDLAYWLLPASRPWELSILVLALAGIAWAIRTRAWFLIAVAVQTGLAGLAFATIASGGQLYNLRVLPFWYLGRWMLAAAGLAWLIATVVTRVRRDRSAPSDPRLAPVIALVGSTVVIGSTWGWWGVVTPPSDTADGTAEVAGVAVEVTKGSLAPALVFGGGPQTDLEVASRAALRGLVSDVARSSGCGRIAWDETEVLDDPGAVQVGQAPWQAPIWTDGCITPLTGILSDSSATAPTALLTQDLVSVDGLRVMPANPDAVYDLSVGVQRMRTMGIRYYLTHGGPPAEDAANQTGLSAMASAGPWTVWEVSDSAIVVPLPNEPVVVEPAIPDGEWDTLSAAYFLAGTFDTVPLAQHGPDSWQRVGISVLPPQRALTPVTVTEARVTPESVAFTVDRVGAPVLVRVSAYPGWSVIGADGPYRVTPNFMVVVPTATSVELTRVRTSVDWLGIACLLVGTALVMWLAIASRTRHPQPNLPLT